MNKKDLRLEAFNFLGEYGEKIRTKFNNICGKTGQYSVPDELFQKRTHRKNRVLISWKTVKSNRLTIENLQTFSGGVVIEFINEDYFAHENQLNPVFLELKNRVGSNDTVSAIISIRSENGTSSSAIQRDAFETLTNGTVVKYRDNEVVITKENYQDYFIEKIDTGGEGNEKWQGFLFVSIKGGQQDTIESHTKNQTIFNPACEFATQEVCYDIDLVMAFFALASIDISTFCTQEKKTRYISLINDIENILKNSKYENKFYTGNLLDYCKNHPSIKMVIGKLYDPIQVKEIHIEDFEIDTKEDDRNLDFTHNEAVFYDKFYWDNIKKG